MPSHRADAPLDGPALLTSDRPPSPEPWWPDRDGYQDGYQADHQQRWHHQDWQELTAGQVAVRSLATGSLTGGTTAPTGGTTATASPFDAILHDGSTGTEVQPLTRRAAREGAKGRGGRRRGAGRRPAPPQPPAPAAPRLPARAAPQPAPTSVPQPSTSGRRSAPGTLRRGAPAAAVRGTPPRRPALQRKLSAPQLGIAGALGLATIAAPLGGVMAAPSLKSVANPIAAAAAAPAPAFPMLRTGPLSIESFRALPRDDESTAPPMLVAPQVTLTRASRAQQRSVLPGCDGVLRPTNAPNGELPASVLCTLWDPKHRIRADAAVALAKLNIAYKHRFGQNICLTDSYRTLAEQRRLRAIKPGLAAVPGTSEHGWGLAVDLCGGVETGYGARYQWLRADAPAYGWDNPAWARGGYEPWHWEYVAGESGPSSGN